MLRCALLLLTLLLPCALPAANLRLVGDSWPPFVDSRLPGNGLAVELVTTALKRAGFDSSFQQVPWSRALYGVRSGDYDIALSVWYEPARSLYGQFSRAYLSNRIRLLQRKGRGIEFSRLSDLRPYRIAVVRDYAYAPEFDRDSRLQKVNVTSFANAARMLEAGRVDLAVEDELALGVAFKGELADLRDKLEVLPIPLGENGLHLLVSLRNPRHDEIVDGFDLAIRGMRDDGSYQRLLERYGAR
ncbi:substrate-binding periplasmic protein [Pseudomonas aeruginosa]|uniref:substrate-binding periplasmic protein n=1 Tax=Pseudomonas aeruginosa TaxID=287 RepID=UPI000EB52F7D|nr:transporter substrate-binding domain-containing protein [Pseudomonas aeruginosa]WBH20011.1 hypothetical protein PALA1_00454 [Pseudomonas aeruginosa]